MKILYVEDDYQTRDLLSGLLRLYGLSVDVAEDGQRGLEMWEKGRYDLILMDVQMPRMDGLTMSCRIRERERALGGHTPIIAVTAHAYGKDEAECLAMGIEAVLSKPLDVERCLLTIHALALRGPVH